MNRLLKKLTLFLYFTLSLFSLSSSAIAEAAKNTAYVGTARELAEALDSKKIEHIVITDNITGNFKIYRWLRSIRGLQKFRIQPQNTAEPVFETEFETWFLKTAPMEILNLQISCPGGGIKSWFIGRKWSLRNCDFTGSNKEGSCAFSGNTDVVEAEQCLFKNLDIGMSNIGNLYGHGTLRKCTFEHVGWCVKSQYGQHIEDCHFNDCTTVLYVWNDDGPASSIVRATVGKGDVWAWCCESRPLDDSDSQPVKIDGPTLQFSRALAVRIDSPEAFNTALLEENKKYFYSFCDNYVKNAQKQDQFTGRNKDCEDTFRQSIKNKDFAWVLQHARSEWDKYQHAPDKENLEHLLVLYRQFVQLPILQISDRQELEKFVNTALKRSVSDTYLCQNMANLFTLSDVQEPAMPFAVSPYIQLAGDMSTSSILASTNKELLIQTIRSSLDDYIQWIEFVQKCRETLRQLPEQLSPLQDAVSKSIEISDAILKDASRLTRALYFDLPLQVFLCSRYAEILEANGNKDQVEQAICESVPFYKIYGKLGYLTSTEQVFKKYLLKNGEKILGTERLNDLTILSAVDPNMIWDSKAINDLLRNHIK
ncbi:hypothetical protein [Pyramidobacter porci]